VFVPSVHKKMPWNEVYSTFVDLRFNRAKAINLDSERIGTVGQWEGEFPCWLRDTIMRRVMPILGPKELVKHARNVDSFLFE
jgi:hypothetical protein